MNIQSFKCPNCGANYNPAKYTCDYCGSYIFLSNDNYVDFSNVKIELPQKPIEESGKYPGIYVFGRLLGKGERPVTLGAANYYQGVFSTSGGKLLLTNKSLSFSAHAFNVGKQEVKIELNEIKEVKLGANLLISQHILVKTTAKTHDFVVYHGKDWIRLINECIAGRYNASMKPDSETKKSEGNYIEELQQLKMLLDKGIITEEEFAIKKRMLLGL